MDVDHRSFWDILPTILKRIAASDFVTFDLELSGIPIRQRTGIKATLQERYAEVKAAAEKYQILQVGLTVAEADVESGKYIIRPFNFNLSPLIDEGFDMDRSFTYSTSAVHFLINNGYHMDAPFLRGIPYMTKREEAVAREKLTERLDRTNLPDIQIRANDTRAQEFVLRVRREISDWIRTQQPHPTYYDVVGVDESDPSGRRPLNSFERRLVHQTVRSGFPHLQTASKDGVVQVKAKDQEELDQARLELENRITRALSAQTGFRWVAEALAGGDLSAMDVSACGRVIHGEPEAVSSKAFARRMGEILAGCKDRPKVLVGHNCFLDLVFIYNLFYGDLPAKVEDFEAAVHEVFPMVIDTKYLWTAGDSPLGARNMQLWQIAEELKGQGYPSMELSKDQPQYGDGEEGKYHEAGFDSLVTAQVFLKQATRLERNRTVATAEPEEGKKLEANKESESGPHSSNSSQGVGVNGTPAAVVEPSKETATDADGFTQSKKSNKVRSTVQKTKSISNSFFHQNMFDKLQSASQEDQQLQEKAAGIAEKPVSSSSAKRPKEMIGSMSASFDELQIGESVTAGQDESGMLPLWETEFWRTYGNKLRVYGTVEEVCELSPVAEKGQDCQGTSGTEEAEAGEAGLERRPSLLRKAIRLFNRDAT